MSEATSSFLPRRETLNRVLGTDALTSPGLLLPHWFAVYTFSRHEKQVGVHCDQRDIESYVPLYREVKTWKNRCKVTIGLPLFPSYLFVRIRPEERYRVLSIPGVVSILGAGSKPSPIPESYISWLRWGSEANKLEPHPGLEVGDRARIVWGPMSGATGILIRKQKDLRVVLQVPMLNRSVSVEVTMADIEPVDPSARRTAAA